MQKIIEEIKNKKRQSWIEAKKNEFLELFPNIDKSEFDTSFKEWYNEIKFEDITLEDETVSKVSKGFFRHPTEEYLAVTKEELGSDKDYKKLKSLKLLQIREAELKKLVITIDNGKQFNGSKEAIADLESALKTAEEYEKLEGMPLPSTTNWRLYDNTIQSVTIEEIREAYVKGNLQYSTKFIELSRGL